MTAYKTVQRAKIELESTVDSVAQLICVLDKYGHVLRLNKTFERWGLDLGNLDQDGFNQDNLGKVSDANGKHLHAVMHPACTNAKCYLKQLIDLINKIITTGEPTVYSGFDSELNQNLLVQMIPVGTGEAVGIEKIECLNQVVMIFFDITESDFFNLTQESLNRWHQIDAATKVAILSQKKSHQLTLNSNLSQEKKQKEVKFKDIEKIKREWELAIDVLPQIICLVSTGGVIARANRAIESWGLGNVMQIKGRHIHDMLHPDCLNDQCYLLGFNALIADVLTTYKSAEYQVFDAPLNRHLHFQLSAMPVEPQSASHFVVVLV